MDKQINGQIKISTHYLALAQLPAGFEKNDHLVWHFLPARFSVQWSDFVV